ncbi:uncharacterized protein TNCV_3647881 [Trichonephila clavipes]|nr:uncharacterized protein TNCV_3647881 [Trichonephila clavipes]
MKSGQNILIIGECSEEKQNNLVVRIAGKRLTVNVDQVRLYHQRISGKNEIRVGSSDRNGSRREVIEKGTSLNEDQGERHTSIASKRRSLIRSSPTVQTEPNRRTKKCRNETLGCKRRRVKIEETAVPGTSSYNVSPRRGERVESRPSSEKMTHQRGPVLSRGRREQHYSPYDVEQGRSCGHGGRGR